MIREFKEDINSNFDGTIVDIESIGEFNNNRLYKVYNDSRQYENMQQVILGFIILFGFPFFTFRNNAIEVLLSHWWMFIFLGIWAIGWFFYLRWIFLTVKNSP